MWLLETMKMIYGARVNAIPWLSANHHLLTSIAVEKDVDRSRGTVRMFSYIPGFPTPKQLFAFLPLDVCAQERMIYGYFRRPSMGYGEAHTTGSNISPPLLHDWDSSPFQSKDPCIYTSKLLDNKDPIYVGICVDNFTYFSSSDETKKAFKTCLAKEIKAEFMGPVSWFLGCLYVWDTLPDGRLTVHISQTTKIESLLDQFDLTDSNPVHNVYCLGFPIDRIASNGTDPSELGVPELPP